MALPLYPLRRWLLACLLAALLIASAGCSKGPARPPAPSETAPSATASEAGIPPQARQAPSAAGPGPSDPLLALPPAFRYEATLRPVGGADPSGGSSPAPATVIRGQYRQGQWAQNAVQGPASPTALPEEAIVFGGASYTRSAGETLWTRWPGVSFDAAYGLASPFTVLRLYRLAEQQVRGDLSPVPGAPEPTLRIQTAISASAVKRLMEAGVAAVAPDATSRAALRSQIATLVVPQTITYWVSAEPGSREPRIYRAAATLLAADAAGQPTPWVEATWRFWGYDDPAIAVVPPADYRDAPGATEAGPFPPTAEPVPTSEDRSNLVVRVFASPGVPAENLAVTVYAAGQTKRALDWRNQPEARFQLPPGLYDVLIQMHYAERWLKGLEVRDKEPVIKDVTFDFGMLKVTVTQNGQTIPVDIVTYPAGDRKNWLDWRSDNPALMRLRAGMYDVEIAYGGYKGKATVTGLVVKAGETTERVIEVPR